MKAFITGISGQDGSFLAELLLAKGYEVHGLVRRHSVAETQTFRLQHVFSRLHLHYGDLSTSDGLARLLREIAPDEVYNLAAMSHVRVSFDQPIYTADVVATGTLRLLEALRDADLLSHVVFYQAGSSEMFGAAPAPQSENTPFDPQSPYACAKVAAHHLVGVYEKAYGLKAARGILGNHESERRSETFVTRKITRALGRARAGTQRTLALGKLGAQRDWGFAGDYVEAMWLMVQARRNGPIPPLVIGTGESRTVGVFLDLASELAGRPSLEVSTNVARLRRPSEVDHLQLDASLARRVLGWTPKMSFRGLVHRMVDFDITLAQRERNGSTASRETEWISGEGEILDSRFR